MDQRELQSFCESHPWLPFEDAPGLADVRAAALGIVLRQGLEHDRRGIVEMAKDAFDKVEKRDLLRIPEICRQGLAGHLQTGNAFNEVGKLNQTLAWLSLA